MQKVDLYNKPESSAHSAYIHGAKVFVGTAVQYNVDNSGDPGDGVQCGTSIDFHNENTNCYDANDGSHMLCSTVSISADMYRWYTRDCPAATVGRKIEVTL